MSEREVWVVERDSISSGWVPIDIFGLFLKESEVKTTVADNNAIGITGKYRATKYIPATSATATANRQLRAAQLDAFAIGGNVRVSEPFHCPRCKEGTTFVISVKDAPGLWISCGACKWIINSAISGDATANPELRAPSSELVGYTLTFTLGGKDDKERGIYDVGDTCGNYFGTVKYALRGYGFFPQSNLYFTPEKLSQIAAFIQTGDATAKSAARCPD